jgi:hypothetical protein
VHKIYPRCYILVDLAKPTRYHYYGRLLNFLEGRERRLHVEKGGRRKKNVEGGKWEGGRWKEGGGEGEEKRRRRKEKSSTFR